MQFRQRKSTDYLCVHFKETGGLSLPELHREARKVGKLTVDHHFIVQDTGLVDEGRDLNAVAGDTLDNSTNAVHILVDAKSLKAMSDAQKVAFSDLIDMLKGEFPEAEVTNIK